MNTIIWAMTPPYQVSFFSAGVCPCKAANLVAEKAQRLAYAGNLNLDL